MYFDQYDQYGQYAQYAQYYQNPYGYAYADFNNGYPVYSGYSAYNPYVGYENSPVEGSERQITGAGQQLINLLLQETFGEPTNQVNAILQIFLTRRRDVLQLIENFGVPPRISQALTRRIIRFVIVNAPGTPGNLAQQVRRLVDQFFRQDQLVVPILRLFGVPEFVIRQYITRVIRITLRNLIFIPGPGIDRLVNQLLDLFEQRFPNFLGLTTIYRIPIGQARNIVRGIIRFTLLNIERISEFGTIQQRAQEMVNLIRREQPELIRIMVRNGVPANVAEDITRRIVIFTLREGGFEDF